MRAKNWYVITGGPSTGKSTLLNELKRLGHHVVPEAATQHIDEEIAKGRTLKEIREDEKHFQDKVLDRKLEVESKQDQSILTFFDRGIHDTMAYLESYGHAISEEIRESTQSAKYAKVFLLEPFDFFEESYTRTESLEFTKRVNKLLQDIYANTGHEVVPVPVMPPEDRARFVLQHAE